MTDIINDTKLKTDLAYAYRFCARLKLDDLTYTHISARHALEEAYFIYPFGLLYEEVVAQQLLKVTLAGEILEGSEEQYNKTGYIIHGSIYENRPDVNAIIHFHTPATVAVSAMKRGLLPISQWALHFHNQVAYYPYNSLALSAQKHGNDLVKSLDDKKILLLENHGALTCGKNLQEAFFYAYHLEKACQTQCMALQTGEELIMPSEEICAQSNHDLLSFEENLGFRDWQALVRTDHLYR